ncbi:MAG: Spx/MgsR family RNA polymerase-binding regulatory protein [Quisquiliibacterium sp.]
MTETLVKIYGIESCDQVRRARGWFKARGIKVSFHDYRKHGLDACLLERWLSHLPWNGLLNRRGLAWRKLDPQTRVGIVDKSSALEAMLGDPLLVKRPVIEVGDRLLVGFSDEVLNATFESKS